MNAEEFDVAVPTGASTADKYGISIVKGSNDAVRGAYDDSAISINDQDNSNTPGWHYGISFGSYAHQWAFATDSTLIMAQTRQLPSVGQPVALNGVDFRNVNFSSGGYAFASPGFGVTNLGNVGIGSTSPYAKFSIQASSTETMATLFAIASSTNNSTTTLFSISNTGSTTASNGINITAGCFALNGTCISTGSSLLSLANTWAGLQQFSGGASSSVQSVFNGAFFGATATSSFDSLGNLNLAATASLKQAGNTILDAISTGFDIFGGQGAGASVISIATSSDPTSGSFSTALGYQALGNATSSAYQSVAIGYQALKSSATISGSAGGNTAVGFQAMLANTSGNLNVAFGADALAANTTGVNNVALGATTLFANTSGQSNVAVGRTTLSSNTSGLNNVGIGTNALLSTQTGSSNTAVGNFAGQGVASNSFSNAVLFGFKAGFALTTGSNNVFLGSNTASTTATGANNIAIGYDVALPVTNGSNQLNIGNLLFGTGINGESATLSTGNIGIGTSTPYSRLTVWGADAASSTAAFTIANSASTTEFSVFDGGNAQLAGTLTQNSDQRLKTNVLSLDASSSLAAIDALNPVTFNWINPTEGTTPQLGFIAQQVQQLFPALIATTSPTPLTPGGTLGLNYIGLISPIVSAIQALSMTVAGFAESFTSKSLTQKD